jgi:ethanolamine ammonia-lyase small subunit
MDNGDAAALKSLYSSNSFPQVQIVISDGLNADAVNENLAELLVAMKGQFRNRGISFGRDIYVRNGRVRAGYHIGEILDVPIVVHLIGERPGTGTNNLSCYITYGHSLDGRSQWRRIEHSRTTALCSINKVVGVELKGASLRIAQLVSAMMSYRCSGVALTPHLNDRATSPLSLS